MWCHLLLRHVHNSIHACINTFLKKEHHIEAWSFIHICKRWHYCVEFRKIIFATKLRGLKRLSSPGHKSPRWSFITPEVVELGCLITILLTVGRHPKVWSSRVVGCHAYSQVAATSHHVREQWVILKNRGFGCLVVILMMASEYPEARCCITMRLHAYSLMMAGSLHGVISKQTNKTYLLARQNVEVSQWGAPS
jgi:hypothetical protein